MPQFNLWRVLILAVSLLAYPGLLVGQSLLLLKPTPIDPVLLQGFWKGNGPGGDCTVEIKGKVLKYVQPPDGDSIEEFWFETTFTVPTPADYQQLHATIRNSSPEKAHIGKAIITLFKIENEQLCLGVIDSRDEAPEKAVAGTWEDVMDEYVLSRVLPKTREGKSSSH